MIRLDQMRGGWAGLAALASGALAALALPPIGWWPALGLAVPAMLLLIEGALGLSPKAAFGRGFLIGFGYFIVAFHWIGAAFLVDAKTYLWMMPFAVAGLAGFMALYWGLAALACRLAGLRGLALNFGFATAIGLVEWLRGHLLTGFPWAAPGLVATSMGALAQTAALVGMTGLTLLVMLWAGLPLALVQRGANRWVAALALALMPGLWLWGAWHLRAGDDETVPGVVLRLVQPDIGQDEKWRESNARTIFDRLIALSSAPPRAGARTPTFLVWPESAVPFLIDESAGAKAELARLLGGTRTLVTGAIRRDPGPQPQHFYNSMITFDGTATVVARYDKWRLVPGGEFLPLAWLLEPLGFRKVVTVPGSFDAGAGPVTIAVPGAPPVAMAVCYEIIFPHGLIDPSHRPQWILNVTNDGWFGGSTGPYQHLAQARMRAIEQGLPVARAANTGISAVIDGHGRVLDSLPLGTQGNLDSLLPVALEPTPYARFGDTGLGLMVLLGLVAAGLLRRGGLSAAPNYSFGQVSDIKG